MTSSKWGGLPKRYKYASLLLAGAATYTGYHRYMAPSFEDKIRLVFPEYKKGNKTVRVISSN